MVLSFSPPISHYRYNFTLSQHRVCSRCLSLKDTVVGHTDESGVTIPPLHPRCRCVIIYREVDKARFIQPKSLTADNIDIRTFQGALKPDSPRAEEHAYRYYGLVRSMKTDCQRIAFNTNFREEDILRIKNHIFFNKHELYDGEIAQFYPSYHMAQSWQRLIEGREIQPQDIVLLNHEFLESVVEAQGLTAEKAHAIAEKVYNYAEYLR